MAAHGLRKAKSKVAITEDLVHIGSCTKAMTAVPAARYVDRGMLRWDSTLDEVLPELAGAVHEGFHRMTLLDCLTTPQACGRIVLSGSPMAGCPW